MSASKRNLFFFGAIGSAAVSAFSFQAIADSIPAATFGAATTVNTIKVDGGPGSASTHFSSTTDFGQGTISSLPLPTMSVIAQESSTNIVTVGLSMTYFFEFVGPVTEILPSQPIFITSGSVSGSVVSGSGSGGVSAAVNQLIGGGGGPLSYSLGAACAGSGCPLGASFSQMTQPSILSGSGLVQTNAIYVITMNAGVAAGQGDNITAFLDPHITYDLSADAGITLELSAGVGNTPLTATPLPAALPLFATGLGALGLLGWCMKKKAAVLAA